MQISMKSSLLYDHVTAKLSNLDMEMVVAIPPGGNWKDIPLETVKKSRRLQQIQASGGRTTYYCRLKYDTPSYTINTFFNRPGNGCFIHPEQNRLISLREAARLQSFPDDFRFLGGKPSKYKQIGNAVPPLMAKGVAQVFQGDTAIDLFAGAGGLSWGLHEAGFKCLVSVDFEKNMCETLRANNFAEDVLNLDLTENQSIEAVCETAENHLKGKQLDLCAGGPPCQGFSTAGNWDHTDPRNNLFKPFLEIVKRLQPINVLIENVPGIKSMMKGSILKKILSELKKMEYSVHYTSLKSEIFGVPQRRRRVFIFASLSRENIITPRPLFSGFGDDQGIFQDGEFILLPPPLTVGDAISDLPKIPQGAGSEVMEYDSTWIKSKYQLWLRGQISFNTMYEHYFSRSKNH
ncbi:DNA (cytosine-5-)-methyltransferase [Candidatus Thorarchaeota archaeon]|nr:MAG: DNA (cytosine-5-)-methyltransferase [Candidatus Thorarchaeota archaeon]